MCSSYCVVVLLVRVTTQRVLRTSFHFVDIPGTIQDIFRFFLFFLPSANKRHSTYTPVARAQSASGMGVISLTPLLVALLLLRCVVVMIQMGVNSARTRITSFCEDGSDSPLGIKFLRSSYLPAPNHRPRLALHELAGWIKLNELCRLLLVVGGWSRCCEGKG